MIFFFKKILIRIYYGKIINIILGILLQEKFNKLTSQIVALRLAQENLASKNGNANFVKKKRILMIN